MSLQMDHGQRLRAVLDAFNRVTAGVRGSAVADRNGLQIASAFRGTFDVPTVSAMTTMVLRAARDVFRKFGFRDARAILMESDDAVILVMVLPGDLSVLAVAAPDANLGLVRLQLQKLGQEIVAILT